MSEDNSAAVRAEIEAIAASIGCPIKVLLGPVDPEVLASYKYFQSLENDRIEALRKRMLSGVLQPIVDKMVEQSILPIGSVVTYDSVPPNEVNDEESQGQRAAAGDDVRDLPLP